MDDREDGDDAGRRDGRLLRISLDPRARTPGAIARCRFTDRHAQGARHYGFNRDFVSSRVLRWNRCLLSAASLFSRAICSARAHRSGEAVFVSRDFRQLRPVSSWCFGLLFLVATKNDPLFLPRHRISGLGAHLDCAAVLLFCDAIHDRVRSGF